MPVLAASLVGATASAWTMNWGDYSNVAFTNQGGNSYAATFANVDNSGVNLTVTLTLNGSGTFSENYGWVNWGYHANGLAINADFASLADSLSVDFSFSSAVGGLSYTVYDIGVDSTHPHWQTGNRPGGFQDAISGLSASVGGQSVEASNLNPGSGVGYSWQDGVFFGTNTSSWEHSSTNYNLTVAYNENVDKAGFTFGAGNVDGQSQDNPQGQSIYLGQFSFGEAIPGHPSGGQIPEPTTTAALLALGALGGTWFVRRNRKSSR